MLQFQTVNTYSEQQLALTAKHTPENSLVAERASVTHGVNSAAAVPHTAHEECVTAVSRELPSLL